MNPLLLFAGLFVGGSALVRDFERSARLDILSTLSGERKALAVRVRYPGIMSPVFGEAGTVELIASDFKAEGLPLFTEPWRSKKGVIRNLRLDLSNFYLRDLRCERLTATIPDNRFDFGLAQRERKIRLSKSGTGDGSVSIRAQDLPPFILRKYPEIKEVSVETDGPWLVIKGLGQFLIFNASFEIHALMRAEGRQLWLVRPVILIDGSLADDENRDALLSILNPIVDFDRDFGMQGAVDARSVSVDGGRITVQARVTIPAKG